MNLDSFKCEVCVVYFKGFGDEWIWKWNL